jgi:Tripartite tricarboxylate transporter family receptor
MTARQHEQERVMKQKVSVWPAIVIALALLGGVVPARAQDYPSRPITVIVPFPPGGASDVVARIVTNEMSRTLGQSFIIENVGGAGGTIGSARSRRHARRLHPACGGDGFACGGAGADAERQVRSRCRLRADRHHRAFAGRYYRA